MVGPNIGLFNQTVHLHKYKMGYLRQNKLEHFDFFIAHWGLWTAQSV
jgi:hypothetical protein